MKIKILVDSCSDLPNDIMENYDIDMVPLNIAIDDKTMLDRIELKPEEYYEIIDKVGLPQTSSPNLAQWKEAFDRYLKDGDYDQLVVVTIGHKLSNTNETANVAAKKFYPERVRIFDSLSASAGEGLIAIKMRELLDKGYDYETVYSFAEKLRNEVIQVGFMDTLKMLVRTGRVTKAQSFFAKLIHLKPLIITKDSENKPLGNAISLKAASKKAINELVSRADNSMSYSLFITHADAEEHAKIIAEQIKEKLTVSKTIINYMGPVVGSRVGVGAQVIAIIPDKEPETY